MACYQLPYFLPPIQYWEISNLDQNLFVMCIVSLSCIIQSFCILQNLSPLIAMDTTVLRSSISSVAGMERHGNMYMFVSVSLLLGLAIILKHLFLTTVNFLSVGVDTSCSLLRNLLQQYESQKSPTCLCLILLPSPFVLSMQERVLPNVFIEM